MSSVGLCGFAGSRVAASARLALAGALLASALLAEEKATRVVLVDEEGACWLARRGALELVHLDGALDARRRELGALCARMIASNVASFAPDAERQAALARSFREHASAAQRGAADELAAGAQVPVVWVEALSALDLAPPRLALEAEPIWSDLPAGAMAALVLDATGRLCAIWGGRSDGAEVSLEAFRATRAAGLLERARPGPFDIDNGWTWTLAEPLAVESGRCAERPARRRPPRDEQERKALERFPQEREAFDWRLSVRQRSPLWSIADLDLPSGLPSGRAMNDLVRARYFRGERGAEVARPAFILLHHLQENFALEEAVARSIAARGVDVVLVVLPYYGPRHPPRQKLSRLVFGDGEAGLARVAAQAASDVTRVRDFLSARPDVTRVALGGISLGGIFAALIGGVDGDWPRLAPLLAGGDLGEILRQDSREARGIRRELAKVGLELDDILRTWSALDPIAFGGRVDPATVLLINARADEVIPRSSTLALSRSMGGAAIEWFDGGHISVAKELPQILDRLVCYVGTE